MFTKAQAEAYFLAEKQAGLIFLIVGVVAILAAVAVLIFLKTPLFKGLAIPLIVIGIVQGLAGNKVFTQSDVLRKDVVYKIDMNPDAIKNEEIPRMEKMLQNAERLKWLSLLGLIAGAVLVFLFRQDAGRAFWLGVGAALIIQCAIFTGGEYLAGKRGAKYLQGLHSLVK